MGKVCTKGPKIVHIGKDDVANWCGKCRCTDEYKIEYLSREEVCHWFDM